MMMKTMHIGTLMIAAMVVAVMMGCSSNTPTGEVVVEQMSIEFTSNGKATKAAIAGNSDLAAAGGFMVWGWKTPTPSPTEENVGLVYDWTKSTQVFNAVKVSLKPEASNADYIGASATNWTYNDKKNWDRTCSYCFYAAAPVSSKIALNGSNAGEKVFQIMGVTSHSSAEADCTDYMIHRRTDVNDIYDGKNAFVSNVPFTFQHVLSKVSMKVKNEMVQGAIQVNAITLSGWDNGTYNFTQQVPAPANRTLNNEEWSTPAVSTNQNGKASFLQEPLTLGPEEMVEVPNCYLMVPQNIAAGKLQVSVQFSISYADGSKDDFNVSGALENEQMWGTDCQTIYLLRVSPGQLLSEVESTNWSNGWK